MPLDKRLLHRHTCCEHSRKRFRKCSRECSQLRFFAVLAVTRSRLVRLPTAHYLYGLQYPLSVDHSGVIRVMLASSERRSSMRSSQLFPSRRRLLPRHLLLGIVVPSVVLAGLFAFV